MVVRTAGLASLTVTMLGAVELHQRLSPASQRELVFDRYARSWCRALLRLFGVKILCQPKAIPPKRANARLIVANHRSPIEIAAILSLFGGHALSRADIANWPILGRAARKAGTIFVEREQGTSGLLAIRAIQKRLRQGATILVFPEGTTFAGDEVRPFRQGAFVGLSHIDVEIVPVGIAYPEGTEFVEDSFLEHLRNTAERRSTRIALCIGEPQKAKGSSAEIAQSMQVQVQQLVYKARDLLKTSGQ